MLFSNKKDFLFKINKTEDVKNMNKQLNKNNFDAELIYVANELTQNVINAKTICIVTINKDEVLLNITGDKFDDLEFHLNLAKKAFSENIKSISLSFESGKGLISILRMNWFMEISQNSKINYSMLARRQYIQ